jgi:hypothetical protein
MGAGVKAAEHGRYTTPTDDVRRRHGLLPPRTGLIYRIMMAHGGVPHSHGELIHRSAWNRYSRKFISKILHSLTPVPLKTAAPGALHSPTPIPLVTPMDRYARSWMSFLQTNVCASERTPHAPSLMLQVAGRGYAELLRTP